MTQPTRNTEVLADFVQFCQDNPELRFWQALSAWCKRDVLLVTAPPIKLNSYVVLWRPYEVQDPYPWEGKDGR